MISHSELSASALHFRKDGGWLWLELVSKRCKISFWDLQLEIHYGDISRCDAMLLKQKQNHVTGGLDRINGKLQQYYAAKWLTQATFGKYML